GPHAVVTRGVLAITVGRKSVSQGEVGSATRNDVEQRSPDDCTNDLGHDVRPDLARRKPPARRQSDGDRWVDMATGHMADRIGHGEERETERKGYAQETDADMRERCSDNGAAASTESQPERADRFSY